MKRYNWLITIGMIFLLWFSLAFACNNDRRKNTSYDETTPTRSIRQDAGSELTEQDVKAYFTKFHTERCESAVLTCKVVFDTPIEIGAATRKDIQGGLPPPDGRNPLAYPVTVDYSVYKASKNDVSNGHWTRYEGGTHYFYRDVNYVWNDAPTGVNMTWDK